MRHVDGALERWIPERRRDGRQIGGGRPVVSDVPVPLASKGRLRAADDGVRLIA